MQVYKFGGTSVQAPEQIRQVARILIAALEKTKLIVVVSAMSKVTDQLIRMGELAQKGDERFKAELDVLHKRHEAAAHDLLTGAKKEEYLTFLQEKISNLGDILTGIFLTRELTLRMNDKVCSFGELVNSRLIASFLQQDVPETVFLDSREIIATDSTYGAARVDFKETDAQLAAARSKNPSRLYIMGGFIASDKEDITTTLGRGGSDYSAAIMAASCNAEELQIWTDVDGVMTADPRKVRRAFTLEQITYEEAMEMSHFGAKVIHPPTIQPVLLKNIPIRIRNTFNTNYEGTVVSETRDDKQAVKGISSISDVALINVQGTGLIGVTGIAGRLFGCLAQKGVNIILITQASSEHSITFAVRPNSIQLAQKALQDEFDLELKAGLIDPPQVEEGLSVVAVIGSKMKSTTGITMRLFHALGSNGINVYAIAQGSSELNISTVISAKDESKAISALHQSFFSSDIKAINLFVAGVGLIGGTLLEQIKRQKDELIERHQLEFRLIGVSNSRKMLIDPESISLDGYKERLDAEGETADPAAFVAKMAEMNLPNSVYLDNTANTALVPFYKDILKKSVHIVTPNKVANAGKLEDYNEYRQLSKKHGVHFMYETNVGAGLPVISTLRDLLRSGDKILKIEAVLSGSLSFIFNSFESGKSFSEIVGQAQKLGYTEPDPRVDLSGMDVARKALILAREMGSEIELSDIEVENILPQSCIDATTVDDFMAALKAQDGHFEKLCADAAADGKVLRMIASVEANKAVVGLQAVDQDNPFHSLSGSDNLILFNTERYKERPMVICGPGAGAEVTAAGVFAELISIGKYIS